MFYIKRDYNNLEELNKTNTLFLEEIKDMSTKKAYEFYKKKKNIYKYNTDETKNKFKIMNSKRCSFCTQYISEFTKNMTVEHIETKVSAPQKIYEWDNLLCSCKLCNTSRGTNPYNSKYYLDPTKIIDIDKYFSFKFDGSISVSKKLTDIEREKAEYMIKLYKLDREELNVERREFFLNLLDDEYYAIMKKRKKDAQDIFFLSVFTYYKEREKENGE